MVVFLDTAFVLSLILETDETDIAKRYFEETTDSLVTSISVYEEAFYVGVRLLAEERLNVKGKYDLGDYIKRRVMTSLKTSWKGFISYLSSWN